MFVKAVLEVLNLIVSIMANVLTIFHSEIWNYQCSLFIEQEELCDITTKIKHTPSTSTRSNSKANYSIIHLSLGIGDLGSFNK
jgi:hypothetical protein